MSDPRVAREFFALHLPEEMRKVTDLENLELQPRSHIDEMGKEWIVDVLYKTTIAGHDAYLYLLVEHQSTPDPLMAFRMLKYTFNVIDQYLKATGNTTLPLIYSIVIYHAKKPYPHSTDVRDSVDAIRVNLKFFTFMLKPPD